MSTTANRSPERVRSHPSYFELDTFLLDHSQVSSAAQTHIASCVQCSHYLQQLRGLAGTPLPSQMQKQLQQTAMSSSGAQRPSWLRRIGSPRAARVTFAVAAAAILPLLLPKLTGQGPQQRPALTDPLSTTREKGAASAVVYIQRGQQVLRWEEGSVIHTGDKLRLEVSPWPHSHGKSLPTYISVATETTAKSTSPLRVLYRGKMEQDSPLLLPTSWEVDSQGHHESLIVIWSHQPLHADSLTRDVLATSASSADLAQRLIWRELLLPKE